MKTIIVIPFDVPRHDGKKQFKAYIEGEPGKWDLGISRAEAIGNLVLTWGGEFDVKVAA